MYVLIEGLAFLRRDGVARASRRHDSVFGIDLDELNALATASFLLVLLLETALTDQLTRLVARTGKIGELALADFRDVADERADGRAVGINPLSRRLDDEAREVHVVLFEHRHDVERRILDDHGGTRRIAVEAPDRVLILPGRQIDGGLEPIERRSQGVFALREQRDRIADDVLSDRLVVAVEDSSARRRGRNLPQSVLLGLHERFLIADHLRAEERAQQEDQDARDDDARRSATPDDVVRMEAHAVRISMSGRRIDSAITPATAVTAADSGDHTNSCIASSAPCARWPTSRKIKSNSHLAMNR